MNPVEILNAEHLALTITRLCHELVENHDDFSNTALIGLQPRGVMLSNRIVDRLTEITGLNNIRHGHLDITFHRDDFRRKSDPVLPGKTRMDFQVENLKVVLIDDVLFTGRTIRAGLDALLTYGRPSKVELLTLIDRRFSRHLPIQPDYVGRTVDSIAHEKVEVEWGDHPGEGRVMMKSVKLMP